LKVAAVVGAAPIAINMAILEAKNDSFWCMFMVFEGSVRTQFL